MTPQVFSHKMQKFCGKAKPQKFLPQTLSSLKAYLAKLSVELHILGPSTLSLLLAVITEMPWERGGF